MKKIIFFIFVIMLVVVFGCSNSDNREISRSLMESNLSNEDFDINISVEDIIIRTNKDIYSQDEYVYFVVYNGFNQTVTLGGFSGCRGPVYQILKLINGNWTLLPSGPSGLCEAFLAMSLVPKQKVVLNWNQQVYTDRLSGSTQFVENGDYKIFYRFMFPNDTKSKRAESNEFNILLNITTIKKGNLQIIYGLNQTECEELGGWYHVCPSICDVAGMPCPAVCGQSRCEFK